MSKLIAKIISTVLNPIILLAFVPFYLVYMSTKNPVFAWYWTGVSLVFLSLFSLFVITGVKLKFFSDFDISERSQRPMLYSFAVLFIFLYWILLIVSDAPKVLFLAVYALIFGIIALEISNNFLKASAHVATISAIITALFLIHGSFYLLLGYLLIPLVGWARIKTKNHTRKQVVVGAEIGILTTVVIYVIFKYIVR